MYLHLLFQVYYPMIRMFKAEPRPNSGTSMIELLLAVTVLMTGLLGFSRALVQISDIEKRNEESALAVASVRLMAERMASTEFTDSTEAVDVRSNPPHLLPSTATSQAGQLQLDPRRGRSLLSPARTNRIC